MLKFNVTVALVIVAVCCGSGALGDTRFAKDAATGAGDCSSWDDACTLSTALDGNHAVAGDEVWVQAGTYGPISLVNGVKVIGGFSGTETTASESTPMANQTVIDGGGSARAVISDSNGSSTVLRGFRIINGDGGGDTMDGALGGGGALLGNSSALFVQCVFEDNFARYWGGGVAIHGAGSPQFINCRFHDNGYRIVGGDDEVRAFAGGAVYLYSGSPTFVNCLFHDNKAGEGGVLANDHGIPTFINCTFGDNGATVGNGGGVYDKEGKAIFRNCIVWGNTAVSNGAQIYDKAPASTTVTHSDVQGGRPGTGNIDSDPAFVSPSTNNFYLLETSPCINAGDNTYLPYDVADLDWDGNTTELLPKDLSLDPRKDGRKVDMGAYEWSLGGGSGS